MWFVEMERFWQDQHDGGASRAQEYWMRTPLVHFESPAHVVRRFWAGLVRLAREWGSATRFVCAVNSGPMRAFATTALGYDLGEPDNAEEVRVWLGRDLRVARVAYRGHAQAVQVPSFTDYAGGDAAEEGNDCESGASGQLDRGEREGDKEENG